MTDQDQPVKARPWLRIALFVSLALNLLVAGALIGARVHDMRRGPEGPELVRDLSFGPFTDALLPEDREALRRGFLAHAADFRQDRRQMREDFTALLAVLRSDPFDPARLTELMARQEARTSERFALGRELLSERIAAMTPEARAAFADRLAENLSRRGRRAPDR